MKSMLLTTLSTVLLTSTAFAQTEFYCADENQDVQFNQEQALITDGNKSTSYKFITQESPAKIIFANNDAEVSVELSNVVETDSKKTKLGQCTDGSQKVEYRQSTQASALVKIEGLEFTSTSLQCDFKKVASEPCN